MDRNTPAKTTAEAEAVATREGGVDRNSTETVTQQPQGMSPPARVAWIETQHDLPPMLP